MSQKRGKGNASLATKQLRSPGSAFKELEPRDPLQKTGDSGTDADDTSREQENEGVRSSALQHVENQNTATTGAASSAESTLLQQQKKLPKTGSSESNAEKTDKTASADSCGSENAQSSAVCKDLDQDSHNDGAQGGSWITGWAFAPLSHLTGAVKNTVNMMVLCGGCLKRRRVNTAIS